MRRHIEVVAWFVGCLFVSGLSISIQDGSSVGCSNRAADLKWLSPLTWSCDRIPSDNDTVTIIYDIQVPKKMVIKCSVLNIHESTVMVYGDLHINEDVNMYGGSVLNFDRDGRGRVNGLLQASAGSNLTLHGGVSLRRVQYDQNANIQWFGDYHFETHRIPLDRLSFHNWPSQSSNISLPDTFQDPIVDDCFLSFVRGTFYLQRFDPCITDIIDSHVFIDRPDMRGAEFNADTTSKIFLSIPDSFVCGNTPSLSIQGELQLSGSGYSLLSQVRISTLIVDVNHTLRADFIDDDSTLIVYGKLDASWDVSEPRTIRTKGLFCDGCLWVGDMEVEADQVWMKDTTFERANCKLPSITTEGIFIMNDSKLNIDTFHLWGNLSGDSTSEIRTTHLHCIGRSYFWNTSFIAADSFTALPGFTASLNGTQELLLAHVSLPDWPPDRSPLFYNLPSISRVDDITTHYNCPLTGAVETHVTDDLSMSIDIDLNPLGYFEGGRLSSRYLANEKGFEFSLDSTTLCGASLIETTVSVDKGGHVTSYGGEAVATVTGVPSCQKLYVNVSHEISYHDKSYHVIGGEFMEIPEHELFYPPSPFEYVKYGRYGYDISWSPGYRVCNQTPTKVHLQHQDPIPFKAESNMYFTDSNGCQTELVPWSLEFSNSISLQRTTPLYLPQRIDTVYPSDLHIEGREGSDLFTVTNLFRCRCGETRWTINGGEWYRSKREDLNLYPDRQGMVNVEIDCLGEKAGTYVHYVVKVEYVTAPSETTGQQQ
ncbi:hypothetical protein PROFUN_10929 [Planoprotostelium fungivorum]|uniref:Uncharacterized protein n=1 Tax=Planoprotostelium fungivorum TaxID=1890364 RepID=A0A2P6NC05_9EUKA|nr:hypothetical protein PROFUN_10929 [Planoprotostelium fungivorum]